MNNQQKRKLKAQAHHLKPVVMIGDKGLTDAVCNETDIALKAHELIKVRISGADREDLQTLAEELCARTKAELVNIIGHIAIIYRKNEES